MGRSAALSVQEDRMGLITNSVMGIREFSDETAWARAMRLRMLGASGTSAPFGRNGGTMKRSMARTLVCAATLALLLGTAGRAEAESIVYEQSSNFPQGTIF